MKLTLLQKIFALSIFEKAITYKKGALVLLSLPLSIGGVVSNNTIIDLLFKDVNIRDLVLPIIVIASSFVLYFLFFLVDLGVGLAASKYESKGNPDWVESEKLYSSLGKIGGVLLVDVLLLFIIIFLVIIGFVKISLGILIISSWLNVLAIFYEFHSIGENLKRRIGTKPKYFMFFDRITNVIETKILSKIEKV